ncbi:MAG: exodeoxyribonuclease VII large subunit [Breznakibacter sp.]
MEITPVPLSQLASMVRQSLATAMPDSYWVVAEIAELREHRNGHCYLELIEKDPGSNQITARMKANIWSYSYRLLKPYFETTTRQPLTSGIKVLVKGHIEYQEVFGLSLNIKDIDPSFTLGDIERKRRQIIARLEEEGVLEMNKDLELPLVIQKVAVISSPSAAGYEDFVKQLTKNKDGVKYYLKLFPAIMQGEQTEASVIDALEKIYTHEQFFDLVVIVRGGGATADLMSFDSYPLALNIAQFPLPIFTGIGHERDFSVADLVAHSHLKTPTAVAEAIIDHNLQFVYRLGESQTTLLQSARGFLETETERFSSLSMRLKPAVSRHIDNQKARLGRYADKSTFAGLRYLTAQRHRLSRNAEKLSFITGRRFRRDAMLLDYSGQSIGKAVKSYIRAEQRKLGFLLQANALHDPILLLKRGYSITLLNGRAVKSAKQVKIDDKVVIRLSEGEITGNIIDIK